MKVNHIYDYINAFAGVLSIGYLLKYTNDTLENRIANSPYFKALEEDDESPLLYLSSNDVNKEIFFDDKLDFSKYELYVACLWAAEAYLRIQAETHLTFEAIFLYMPLERIYTMFYIYHEMDFSHTVNEFKLLQNNQSIFDKVVIKYDLNLRNIAKETNVSYDTLLSLKNRKRDIKKANVNLIYKLATYLRIRIETLAELAI